ncbi:reprolysin-like metallopeptidase [Pseudoduganella danionis]|uniref:reprolysin-like metallopeptidase n=1 Tax=Pseudoduganella danionis TaxID=1890295 RepID=UPI0018B046A8|nr:zinc-dependent metalloprotease family protein [Pseudoduganella danionis]
MLMVYTPAVLAKEGSVAAVTAKIRAMVKSANAAYARSDADVLVNLVDIRAVNYKESGNGDIDLNRLLLKADGYLDEVLLWREETGADVVGMLGQGGGGVARLPMSPDSSERDFGFWISNVPTGGDISILAHELGHVLGAGHHLDNPYNLGRWDYSHGQISVGQNYVFSDVMVSGGGLPPGVTASPELIEMFSNPRLYYDGVATGTAEGLSRAANNARTLREMAPLVAAYRPEKLSRGAPLKPVIELDAPLVMLKAPGYGASFSARVDASVFPSLQWQFSDDLGLHWQDLADSLTVSGSRSANVSIAAVDAAAHGRQFRLVATNNSGVSVSGVATLLMNVSLVTQQIEQSFGSWINGWQEIVPATNYIQAIDVNLSVTGHPPAITAVLETLDGKPLARTQVTIAADIPETPIWVRLPFNVAVEPKQAYRLRLSMPEAEDGTYEVRWRGSLDNPYPAGQANFSANTDLSFRVYGTESPQGKPASIRVAGWHLLGNGTLASMQVASLYGDASKTESVWHWNTATARWGIYLPALSADALAKYAAERGADVLTTIDAGQAYWVNFKQAYSMPIPAAVPLEASAYRQIGAGWHMVAIGSAITPQAFHQALDESDGAVNFSSLWVWDNTRGKWYYYSPALAAQGGTALADYAQANGMLDFATEGKLIEAHTGIWIYK